MIPLLEVRLRQKRLQFSQRSKSAHNAGSVSSLDRHRNCLDYVTSCILIACFFLYLLSYRKVTSSTTCHLEAHAGFFRLLMKGIFNPYVLLCTETTLSKHPVVHPKSSCDVHLSRSLCIIQAIYMTVQGGNATSIMGTLAPLRKSHLDKRNRK